MSSKTLLFEDIARTATVFNINTVDNSPTRPNNATGAKKNAIIQLGRYGQTQGNPFQADKFPSTPICPYHMPRNDKRYDEPRLNIKKKVTGDIIQASDINELIDKIKLFEYVWDAETNNINGYAGVSGGSNRLQVSSSALKKILASDGTDNSFTAKNQSSYINVTIPKTPQFFSVSGDSESDVTSKLLVAMGSQIKTGTEFNNPCKHGFPEYLDDVVLLNTTATVDSKYSILNGGFASIQGVKYIQETQSTQQYYNLYYTSGNNVDNFVTGTNGYKLRFKCEEPYVVSYRENNLPDTKEKFFGFILYFLSVVIDNTTGTRTETTTSYVDVVPTIVSSGKMIGSAVGTTTPTSTTKELTINLKTTLTNIPTTSTIWDKVGTKSEFMAWLNTLSDTTITLPKQRVNGLVYQYWDGVAWVNSDGIYGIELITPMMKTYTTSTTTTPPPPAPQVPVTTITTHKIYGFNLGTIIHRPVEVEVKDNWDVLNNTFIDNPDGSISFDTNFFGTGSKLMELLISKDQYQDNGGTDAILQPEDNIIGIYNDTTGFDDTYNSSGIMASIVRYKYTLGFDCPDGSVKDSNGCKLTTTTTSSIIGSLVSDDIDSYTIREEDVTYTSVNYNRGKGLYPKIEAKNYTNIQKVLNSYFTNILNVASTGINNGQSDTITKNLINTFLNNQIATGATFDKDDPDTSFSGYRAQTSALIKVEFYNILVDAYKIIINGCVCNADCACNVNCICNTNCGCNYSG